jgi:cyclic pyranopterin monophosphate synthase
MTKSFSHLDPQGEARMVDVSAKPDQHRVASASGVLVCAPETIRLLRAQALPKGDALTVARVAGIQAAKATASLIPLCHPLPLSHVAIEFAVEEAAIRVRAEVVTKAPTGVEMEALTAVSVAALTLYDMMKAVDRAMRIEGVQVESKVKS